MRNLLLSTFIAVSIATPLSALADNPTSGLFTAEIQYVDDSANLLGGAVQYGDVLSGSYTYDLNAIDESALTWFGKYIYSQAPSGLAMFANGLSFVSVPSATGPLGNGAFSVEIQDNTGDRVYIKSFNNDPVGPGVYVDKIEITLMDSSGNAFQSDSLPTNLSLGDFNSAYINIIGGDCIGDSYYCPNSFNVSAVLTSLNTNIGGTATGLNVDSVICHNVTTGQTVTILQSAGWNCNQAGLISTPGDRITEIISGVAK